MTSPNFVVIGPGKSGTTWLYNILTEHPEIGMSSVKETQFFNEYYDKGFNWYSRFFSSLVDDSFKAIGEVSNTYIFSDKVPKRLYEYEASINLIATLRNPIERAFSHYLFLMRNGAKFNDFEHAIKEEPHIIERGLYFNYISNFNEYFPRSQLLVLIYDDLKSDSLKYAQSIYDFLNVDRDFVAANQNKKLLVASQARNMVVAKLIKNGALLFRDLGFPEVVEKVKYSFLPKLLYKPIKKSKEQYSIAPSTRNYLIDYYSEDVNSLSEFMSRDLTQLWLQGS